MHKKCGRESGGKAMLVCSNDQIKSSFIPISKSVLFIFRCAFLHRKGKSWSTNSTGTAKRSQLAPCLLEPAQSLRWLCTPFATTPGQAEGVRLSWVVKMLIYKPTTWTDKGNDMSPVLILTFDVCKSFYRYKMVVLSSDCCIRNKLIIIMPEFEFLEKLHQRFWRVKFRHHFLSNEVG